MANPKDPKKGFQLGCQEVNILQPEDDEEVSAMDCARLRPDGEYLDNSAARIETESIEAKLRSWACQEMDKLTSSVRVFARAKPEEMGSSNCGECCEA